MAHNLFGERFYGHRTPAWHNLGVVSLEPMTGMDALIAVGGGYSFEKRPVNVFLDGEIKETGAWALVRSALPDDPQERVFDYVTDRYNILQPLEAIEMFDNNVRQPVETLGFLGKGEKMFITWDLGSFDVSPGDEIKTYGFVALGFDALMGASLNVVITRVVCENTWNSAKLEAASTNVKGRGRIWSGKHTSTNMQRDLGIWMEYVQQNAEIQANLVKDLFKVMNTVPMGDYATAHGLLNKVYTFPPPIPDSYPPALRKEKQDGIDKARQDADDDIESVIDLFENSGTAIDATAWGLFNSVTEYENWGRETHKAPENSILFGERGSAMNRAASVIGEYAKLYK